MRVSATTLESFRLFQTSDWFTYEKLVEDWTGEREFDPIMVRGSSFHEIIENWKDYKNTDDLIENKGWQWHKNQLQPIAENEQLTGVAEVKGTMDITLPNGEIITVVGVVDRLDSYEATEYKTTENFNTDKYQSSVQWRIYCLIFGLKKVTYKVACVDKNNPVNILAFEQVEFNAYEGMQQEIEVLLNDFVNFCKEYGFYKQIGLEAHKQ